MIKEYHEINLHCERNGQFLYVRTLFLCDSAQEAIEKLDEIKDESYEKEGLFLTISKTRGIVVGKEYFRDSGMIV